VAVHAVVRGDGSQPPDRASSVVVRRHGHGHGHMMRTYRASDVVFRVGVATGAAWVYLRTLIVTPPGVDPAAWQVFAWTGWLFVAMTWVGAVATTIAYMRER
jgi:hypothetical protein